MVGGIQKGSTASDFLSSEMDSNCRSAALFVKQKLRIKGLTFQKKLTKNQIPGEVGSCSPDGGCWFYKGKLIAVFEAKKQGNHGNAIERWFKNNFICRQINNNISYITFAAGEGACEGKQIGNILNIAHLDGFNKYFPGRNSCFLNVTGFSKQFMIDIMLEIINERVNTLGE